MNDKELIEEIQKKSQVAFKMLVEKYQLLVINTCMGFVHNKSDADDLAQEVFIEVFNSVERFRGDAKISTWLYRISVNKSLNYIRDNKKRSLIKSIESFFTGEKNTQFEISDNEQSEAEYQLLNTEKGRILHSAIESLAKNQRIAFVLSKYDDLPYKKIAEVMDISVSSVESLLFRAKKSLQKKLVNFYKEKP